MRPAFFHYCPSPTQERLNLSKSIKAQAASRQACQVPLLANLLLHPLLLQRPAEILSLSDTTSIWMTWMLCPPVGSDSGVDAADSPQLLPAAVLTEPLLLDLMRTAFLSASCQRQQTPLQGLNHAQYC